MVGDGVSPLTQPRPDAAKGRTRIAAHFHPSTGFHRVMKKRNPLKQIGITTEGKAVMGGLFAMADTHGFPLEDSIGLCVQLGCCPGLYDYIESAMRAGWSKEKAVKRVIAACRDAGFPVSPLLLHGANQ